MFLQQIYMYISLTNIQISRSPRGDGDEEENNGILVRKWWMKPGFDYLEDGLPVDASVVRITSIDISHGVLPIWTSHKFKGTKNDHHGLIKPLTLYNWDDSPSTLHSSLSFTGRWTDLIQVLVGKDNPSLKMTWPFFGVSFLCFFFFVGHASWVIAQNHLTKRGCGALNAASAMKERTGGGCPRKGATVYCSWKFVGAFLVFFLWVWGRGKSPFFKFLKWTVK